MKETIEQLFSLVDNLIVSENTKIDIKHLIQSFAMRYYRKNAGLPYDNNAYHSYVFLGDDTKSQIGAAIIIAKAFNSFGFLPEDKIVITNKEEIISLGHEQISTQMVKIVDKAIGGVLFIEKFDELFNKEVYQAIYILIDEMYKRGQQFVVIVSGDTLKMESIFKSEDTIHARFQSAIYFDDSF